MTTSIAHSKAGGESDGRRALARRRQMRPRRGVEVGEARHWAISPATQRVAERSANGAEQLLKLRGVTGHVV